MVAAVVREGDGLVFSLAPSPANIDLERLDGLQRLDCAELRQKLQDLGVVVPIDTGGNARERSKGGSRFAPRFTGGA